MICYMFHSCGRISVSPRPSDSELMPQPCSAACHSAFLSPLPTVCRSSIGSVPPTRHPIRGLIKADGSARRVICDPMCDWTNPVGWGCQSACQSPARQAKVGRGLCSAECRRWKFPQRKFPQRKEKSARSFSLLKRRT